MTALFAWVWMLAALAVAWVVSAWVYGLFVWYMARTTGAAELRAWEARHGSYRRYSGGSAPEDSAGWDGGGE